jgi:hypothetical protein
LICIYFPATCHLSLLFAFCLFFFIYYLFCHLPLIHYTCRPATWCAFRVFSSLRAAKKVIQDQQLRPLLLLHPDALPEFAGIDCSNPNAVVLGLAQQAFSYDSMNAAFRLLMQQPDAPLIAIHKAKYYKAGDGQLALGPGPYAAALEFATGRTAQVGGRSLCAVTWQNAVASPCLPHQHEHCSSAALHPTSMGLKQGTSSCSLLLGRVLHQL